MTTNLRQTVRGGWWGLGDSEWDEYGGIDLTNIQPNGDYTSVYYAQDYPVDITSLPAPGYNIGTKPAPELSAPEFQAEQARASEWLRALPNVLSTVGQVALSASQIASGVKAGAVKPSSTCPSGYLVSGTGQCVSPVSAQWIPGIPNQTVVIFGVAFAALLLLRKR